MNKRINITLPEEKIKTIDRIAAKGDRSAFIDQATSYYIDTYRKKNLRLLLKEEAIEDNNRDLEMTKEWFPLGAKAWQTEYNEKFAKSGKPKNKF